MSTPLILGSGSFIRKQLLEQQGLTFDVVVSGIDERVIQAQQCTPMQVAAELAHAKGQAVSKQNSNAYVISSDQVAVCEGQLLEKAMNATEAERSLQFLAAKTHQLITSSCIYHHAVCIWCSTDYAKLCMRDLGLSEIRDYIAKDQPFGSVGAYYYEQHGAELFSEVCGEREVILGLQATRIKSFLQQWGVIHG